MEQMALFSGLTHAANFSPCERYRYSLDHVWRLEADHCVFIMLNPSTATATEDDPTIRRCIGFARDWGFGSLRVVNLFAFRATDLADLKKATAPVGLENDAVLKASVRSAVLAVAAWGAHGAWEGRADYVVNELLAPWRGKLECLGTTKEGQPRHPLYRPKKLRPVRFTQGWETA